eukprot:527907-Hanusia_phi.AAC.3
MAALRPLRKRGARSVPAGRTSLRLLLPSPPPVPVVRDGGRAEAPGALIPVQLNELLLLQEEQDRHARVACPVAVHESVVGDKLEGGGDAYLEARSSLPQHLRVVLEQAVKHDADFPWRPIPNLLQLTAQLVEEVGLDDVLPGYCEGELEGVQGGPSLDQRDALSQVELGGGGAGGDVDRASDVGEEGLIARLPVLVPKLVHRLHGIRLLISRCDMRERGRGDIGLAAHGGGGEDVYHQRSVLDVLPVDHNVDKERPRCLSSSTHDVVRSGFSLHDLAEQGSDLSCSGDCH